jgi:DNA repair exonuclease SbcCD nuclease subunit
MKALWITDLHLRPIRQEAGAKLLAFILSQVILLKPDMVIVTGDIFHDKNYLYGTMLEMFREFLTAVGIHCPIHLIPGNHDYGVEYSVHSLSGFKGMHNVNIIDTSCRITDKVGMISYSRQEARFQFLMNELGPVEYLFGHFDLNGFDLGSGWEEKESWSDPELFKPFQTLKIVFSGHYHLMQEQTINGIKFVYLGTGATTDFGESDQVKRIGLVDLETGELESIPTGLTLHKTLRINAGDAFPEIPEDDVNSGVEFRLVIKGTQQQIALVDKPRDYAARIAYDFTTETSERLDISSTESKEDVLKKYISFEYKKQGQAIEKSEMDVERLMGLGQRFLAKVGRG